MSKPDVFCDIHEIIYPANLKDQEHKFLEDEYAGPESQAFVQRERRAVSTGWVSLSTTALNIIEGESGAVTCSGDTNDLVWLNSRLKKVKVSARGWNPVFTGQKTGKNDKVYLVLSFRNVSMSQAGEYTCSVSVLSKLKTESISIKVAPTSLNFSPDKDEKSAKEYENFSVTCSGRVSRIWWTYNGNVIDSNPAIDKNVYVESKRHDELKLNFENVQKFNEGEYYCNGNSTFNGQFLKKRFKLQVTENNFLGAPSIRSRHSPMFNNVAKVTIHSNFTAACIGETDNIEWSGPPHFWTIPERSFLTGDNPIYTEKLPIFKNKLLLRFRNVTLNDEGTYKCRVTKENSPAVVAEFNLTVIIPIEFNNTPAIYSIHETGDVKLECAVNGRPKPEVLWYRHDKPVINETGISYDGDSLIIKNVTYQNAGKYICQARQSSIEGATRERAVSLQVFHKPYFPKVNVTIERLKNKTSFIECHADADPPARYTWYKNKSVAITASGSLASNLENGTIELPLLNNTEYEILICNATNSHGSSNLTVNVTAMQMPLAPLVRLLIASQNEVKYEIISLRNESITEFNIEYREKSSNEWNEHNETKPESYLHVYVLDELHPKTEYVIRARSVNPVGVSEFSKEVEVKTSLANQLTASVGVLFAVIPTIYYNFEFL
ncbi:hypothetical protein V9T40_002417 [Parthenolecanium corni]|uniref:Uncharacterized protein n=1 Tax=Parthenolecanium corni TaxID=536013 RepID=A0AAN9TKF7_9HEMI